MDTNVKDVLELGQNGLFPMLKVRELPLKINTLTPPWKEHAEKIQLPKHSLLKDIKWSELLNKL